MIYLDNNATTALDNRVLEAMLPFFNLYYGNPSSLHRQGRLVRSAIDTAREQVAAMVNAHPSNIIFTSGGTEANNIALHCIKPGQCLAVSAIEHPSISEPADYLATQGHELHRIKVDHNGLIDQASMETLAAKPEMASIMLANNETGVIQNLMGHVQQLREIGCLVHTDAVQALGKLNLDFKQLGAHLMSLSSHKIYGPKGCGALIVEKMTGLKPLQLGGGQEQGLRAGTENVPAIIGFGKAAELARHELSQRTEHLLKLRTFLEEQLAVMPQITIFSKAVQRLPNTVQFGVDGKDGEMLLMNLDKKGIAVSSGSACASGGGMPSPILSAMGVEEELAKSALRISLGKDNTEAEVNEFITQLASLI